MNRLLSGIIIIVLVAATFCACGSSSNYSASSSAAPRPAASSASSPPPSYSQGAASGVPYGEAGDSIPFPLLTPSNAEGIKLVYTVGLWLQTTAFDTGTRKLLTVTGDMGGYVQSAYVEGRSLYEPDANRFARYTLRIPSEKLADFLTIMEDNFNLWRLEQNSQEVTAQYQQADSRLLDLLEQEERLLEALKDVADTRERLSLERQLADVQVQISSFGASKGSMESGVAYSTVTVHLYEVNLDDGAEIQEETFGSRLGRTVSGSLNGFMSFCQNSLLFIIAAIPVLIVLAVAAVIILLARRFWRNRGGKIMGLLAGKAENKYQSRIQNKSAEDEFKPYGDNPKD